MSGVRLQIPECPDAQVRALAGRLGVSGPLAQVLVRRGMADPGAAADFLDGETTHPPHAFNGIEEVIAPILGGIRDGRRITVHGDYDVDGICSTAILTGALRGLGATVDWHIPARADGYGLRCETVRALSARGTELLITADCGVSSIEEVALARTLGMEVVITDHHRPAADGRLPDAPILHPRLCDYPCPDLCAAAVSHKLSQALWEAAAAGAPGRGAEAAAGATGRGPEAELDLVALATIADVVALTGENRTLARRGLAALRRTTRAGLRALIEVAAIDPSRLDARSVAFGLAPRLNAAGRLHTADAALELIMTEDPQRAAALATELDRCNRERREIEQWIAIEAEAQVRELGPRAGYVLAGERWHPGVIGIVASRLVERHHRPVVMVALGDDAGRGSARSIPGFDLLAGLLACEEHLLGYGGHRAAAGLQIERERLPAFQDAFAAHAERALGAEDLVRRERVDAIVSGPDLTLELAEELRRLAPFGAGNPTPRLLCRDATFAKARRMGQGRHVRFQVLSGGVHAGAVAFGCEGRLPVAEGVNVHATFTLEVNEWRGVVEPRLVLRQAVEADGEPDAGGVVPGAGGDADGVAAPAGGVVPGAGGDADGVAAPAGGVVPGGAADDEAGAPVQMALAVP